MARPALRLEVPVRSFCNRPPHPHLHSQGPALGSSRVHENWLGTKSISIDAEERSAEALHPALSSHRHLRPQNSGIHSALRAVISGGVQTGPTAASAGATETQSHYGPKNGR